MSDTTKNIYQRIAAVMAEVKYVQKDAQVGEVGKSWSYKAVSHDNVTACVRPAFLDHGIVLTVSLVESALELTGASTKNGFPITRYRGRYQAEFVNIDSPEDKVIIFVDGYANDEGDKHPGKAMSYATKYAILKTLNLETGLGDEGRTQGNGGDPPAEDSSKEPIKPPQSKSAKADGKEGPTKAAVSDEKASPGLIKMLRANAKEKDVEGAIEKKLEAKKVTWETLSKTEAGLLLKWVKELKVEAASA